MFPQLTWDLPKVVSIAKDTAILFNAILWLFIGIAIVTKAITYLNGLLMDGSQPAAPPGGGTVVVNDEQQRELLSDIREQLREQLQEQRLSRKDYEAQNRFLEELARPQPSSVWRRRRRR